MKACWLAVLLLTGCATIKPPAFQAGQSTQALVNWRHGSESLTAEVVFQKAGDGALRLVVSKGAPLLILTQSGEEWTATGPLARGGWRGRPDRAPAPLAGWICFAEAAREKASAFDGECAATGDHFRAIF